MEHFVSSTSETRTGHLHTDIAFVGTESEYGYSHYIMIVDENTRFLFAGALVRKSEASEVILHYMN